MSRPKGMVEPPNELLEAIGQDKLDIPTLVTQKSDSLDFHEVSVWSLREALEDAYYSGYARAAGEVMESLQDHFGEVLD